MNIETNVSSNYDVIVDSSTANLALLVEPYPPNPLTNLVNCLYLSVDLSVANFTGTTSSMSTCYSSGAGQSIQLSSCSDISFSSCSSKVLENIYYVQAYKTRVSNSILHQWPQYAQGLWGLGYCYPYAPGEQCSHTGSTAFQKLLSDSYNSSIFGLDFNNGSSSMQLGGVLTSFSPIVWYTQPVVTPTSHSFMLANLKFCDVDLFQGFVSSWPTLVDTSASCLKFPQEIYDVFHSWLDADSLTAENIDSAPLLSFTFAGNNTQIFYVRLSDLVVNASAIQGDDVAPFVGPRDSATKRLCILRGPSASVPSGAAVPPITVGNQALKSLYFAADFSPSRVGLANKLSDVEISRHGTLACHTAQTCVGTEAYSQGSNDCEPPPCTDYFFLYATADNECALASGMTAIGLIFALLIFAMEFICFFGFEYMGLSERSSLVVVHRIDTAITTVFGRYSIAICDFLLIHVLKLVGQPRDMANYDHQYLVDNSES
jgi:hypothetical protein